MGCKKMDAVTYPNSAVVDFISKNVIPVRIDHEQPVAHYYRAEWTPTLVLLDPSGNEVCREVGYLPPEGIIPFLMLGIGKVRLAAGQYNHAITLFEQTASKYPKSDQAPEAIYFRGVAGFKSTHDLKQLEKAYERLKELYPTSIWTRKAYPYSAVK
jgi:tetratricopeptide (TPR) repeat protein